MHELLVPDTFPAEIGNAILVAGWRNRIPLGQGPLLLFGGVKGIGKCVLLIHDNLLSLA